MLFKRLFKNNSTGKADNKDKAVNTDKKERTDSEKIDQTIDALPLYQKLTDILSIYAAFLSNGQQSQSRNIKIEKENDVLVLNWIAKKKKGYDRRKNNYPKWFMNKYGIVFEDVMIRFVNQGCLSEESGIIKITPEGEKILLDFDYVVYVHDHPQYCLTTADFKKAKNLHKVQLNDIVWGVFNKRIMDYTRSFMWADIAENYSNMGSLLIEEKKYELALDYIFATAYLETSGMRNNNELIAIMQRPAKKGWKNEYLENGMPHIFMLEINNYHVTVPFANIQENLNLVWPEIRKRYLNSRLIASLETILPFRYFEKEEAFMFFKQAVEANGKKGIFTLSDYKGKLKWNTPNENSRSYFYASIENEVARNLASKYK